MRFPVQAVRYQSASAPPGVESWFCARPPYSRARSPHQPRAHATRRKRCLVLYVGCLSFVLLLSSGGHGWSQPGPPSAPAQPGHEPVVRPPSAAPRLPVQQATGGSVRGSPGGTSGGSTGGATPVVPSHGLRHPRKPAGVAAPTGATGSQAKTQAAKPNDAPVEAAPTEAAAAPAEKPPESGTAGAAAARLPRFASLRSDAVNMRVGPGTRYRIDWVYKRREMPVEIEREYDVWRWVRDPEGTLGWVHQATLTGRRSFIVQNADATLRSDPSDTARPVALLKLGVIGRIRSCEAASDWCSVQVGSYGGYLRRRQFWGTLPGEAVTP